ncbi:hypothetical protein E2542_SST13436 [Spatholobus suberectus]|nr:hypothetical protein E2542_SST13436 [Spatholobus suberectus]
MLWWNVVCNTIERDGGKEEEEYSSLRKVFDGNMAMSYKEMALQWKNRKTKESARDIASRNTVVGASALAEECEVSKNPVGGLSHRKHPYQDDEDKNVVDLEASKGHGNLPTPLVLQETDSHFQTCEAALRKDLGYTEKILENADQPSLWDNGFPHVAHIRQYSFFFKETWKISDLSLA